MSQSQATLAVGAQFFLGTMASPLGYTSISETAKIEADDWTVPEIDVTHLLSPSGVRESIPGLLKPGTIKVSGNFIGDTVQLSVPATGQARTIVGWKATAPCAGGAKTLTMNGMGFATSFKTGPFGTDDASGFELTIQCTGPISYAVA